VKNFNDLERMRFDDAVDALHALNHWTPPAGVSCSRQISSHPEYPNEWLVLAILAAIGYPESQTVIHCVTVPDSGTLSQMTVIAGHILAAAPELAPNESGALTLDSQPVE
jgi:hypothetical protein